jgi:hypothetical protein
MQFLDSDDTFVPSVRSLDARFESIARRRIDRRDFSRWPARSLAFTSYEV